MSETSACLLTWMPPTSVLISTCLSSPLASFFTFTLQEDANSRAARLAKAAAMTNAEDLFLRMFNSCAGQLDRTLDSGAALGNTGNAHGKMPANCNFTKQTLDRAYFRHRRVGIRAHIILNPGKVRRKIRIPHG